MTQGRRTDRLANAIRTDLSRALVRHIDDPRLTSLVITGVSVSDDLSVAFVSVRLLIGDDEPVQRKAALRSLSRASGRLRKEVGSKLKLKKVPQLRFEYDQGHDASRRVEELLSEIREERESRGE